jgi:glycosyltransferase involved in cell wall biosynthesis
MDRSGSFDTARSSSPKQSAVADCYEFPPPSKPLSISIALATCQGERFLKAQLDSIARQTLLPSELVVGDDASTDNTLSILEEFAAQAPFPVRIHRNPSRIGFRENFMRIAKRCTGNLIAFCDQDDVWHVDKLARCTVPFDNPEVLLVCHDATIIDSEGRSTNRRLVDRTKGPWLPSLRPLHLQNGLTMVFRQSLNQHADVWIRSIDENSAGLTEHAAHDQWFYFLAINLGRVHNIDDSLLDYRQHNTNAVGAPVSRMLRIDKTPEWRANYYQARAKALQTRILLLHELRLRAHETYSQHFNNQVISYKKSEATYAKRSSIYGSRKAPDRFNALVSTLMTGGYSKVQFGTEALIPDLLFGVFQISPGPIIARIRSTLKELPFKPRLGPSSHSA